MNQFYKKNKGYIWMTVFSAILGTGIFCLVYFLKKQTIIASIDATAIAGVSLIFFGLLILVTKLGAFDTFAYGFRQLGTSIFSAKPNAYNSMADYKMAKYEIRSKKKPTFLAMMAVGMLFIIACIVLEIIYRQNIN